MKLSLLALAATTMLALSGCQSGPNKDSAAWKTDCPTFGEVKTCYHEIGTPDPMKPVIMFAHGLKDSERVFITPTQVPSYYPEFIKALPQGTRIVTLSWGEGFLLTDYPNRTKDPRTATLERYKTVLAELEAKFGFHGPYRLVGHSMGGFNAAQLCAAWPALFTKCALINPMLIRDDVDPWNLVQICPACLLVKPNYDSLAQWRSYRPKPIAGMPPMWVQACPIDIFALYPGAEQYVTKARKLGVSVRFLDTVPGKICTHWLWPVGDLIKFLEAR